MKLNHFQRLVAVEVGVGHDDDTILKKFGHKPWNLTKHKLRRWKRDPDFKAEADKANEFVKDKLVNAKARLILLVADKAIQLMEEFLNAEPYNPETNEGDPSYDKRAQLKIALDLIKELNLGKSTDNTEGPIRLVLELADKAQKIEKKEEQFNPKWGKEFGLEDEGDEEDADSED